MRTPPQPIPAPAPPHLSPMAFRRGNARVSAVTHMAGKAALDPQFEPSLC